MATLRLLSNFLKRKRKNELKTPKVHVLTDSGKRQAEKTTAPKVASGKKGGAPKQDLMSTEDFSEIATRAQAELHSLETKVKSIWKAKTLKDFKDAVSDLQTASYSDFLKNVAQRELYYAYRILSNVPEEDRTAWLYLILSEEEKSEFRILQAAKYAANLVPEHAIRILQQTCLNLQPYLQNMETKVKAAIEYCICQAAIADIFTNNRDLDKAYDSWTQYDDFSVVLVPFDSVTVMWRIRFEILFMREEVQKRPEQFQSDAAKLLEEFSERFRCYLISSPDAGICCALGDLETEICILLSHRDGPSANERRRKAFEHWKRAESHYRFALRADDDYLPKFLHFGVACWRVSNSGLFLNSDPLVQEALLLVNYCPIDECLKITGPIEENEWFEEAVNYAAGLIGYDLQNRLFAEKQSKAGAIKEPLRSLSRP